MRWGTFCAFATVLASGCCWGSSGASIPVRDVHVDVPVTIDGLSELAEDKGFAFERHRATRDPSSTGGSCGHSPVCILVPIAVAVQTLFPPRYDVVTVRDGKRVIIQAAFETDGALITMRARDEDEWREVRTLSLTHIDRTPVVEVARTAILADGGDGERRASAILEQTDLREDYTEALEHASGSYARGGVVAEALLEIGEEMLPWANEWMSAPSTSDDDLAQAIESVCTARRDDAIERAAIDAAIARGAVEALHSGMTCTDQMDHVIGALVALACDPARDPSPALAVLRSRPYLYGEQAPLVAHECNGHRRVLLALEDGAEVEEASLRAAIGADAHAGAYVERLRHDHAEERRILLERIAAASSVEERYSAASRLAFRGSRLDAQELRTIAHAYRAAARETNPSEVAVLLLLLGVARTGAAHGWTDPTTTTPTATDVRPALAELGDDERAPPIARKRWAAARVALGDRTAIDLAIEGIEERDVREMYVQVHLGDAFSPPYVPHLENDATLVAWSMYAAGCPIDAIRGALEAHDADAARACMR